ncbi:MAG: Tol-Pal system protein TolB [Pseudomonadota bacterium]|jgi:TolB protein
MKRIFLKLVAVATAAALPLIAPIAAQAQLRVEIAGVGANQIPIAVANFANEQAGEQAVHAVVRADLERSGVFKLVETHDMLSEKSAIDTASWKARGADALAAGSITRMANGRIDVRYKLTDTVRGGELSGLGLTVLDQFSRLAAHRVADDIFEKLTGVRGAFATRIAYVARSGSEYRLEVADSDGENAFVALRSSEPIISPTWSPDGSKLAYVSFESKKPVVYVQELATRKRIAVANFKGSNSAPAWSPDGRRLAIALSREGHTQIFLINADGSDLRRLTQSNSIDTEPCFSPDGQTLYFTSDRGGGPQIYRMSVDGGDARRVTFISGATYNISPAISPDGKMLAYISRREGRFQVYVLDLTTNQETRLSDTARDESPSFAPNGRYIMYASDAGGRGSLTVVATDGSARYSLSARASNVREPAWGPFTK